MVIVEILGNVVGNGSLVSFNLHSPPHFISFYFFLFEKWNNFNHTLSFIFILHSC